MEWGQTPFTGKPVNGVYKLVDIEGIPVMKESEAKLTYSARKKIFRNFKDGQIQADRLGLISENPGNEEPLLQLVMQGGKTLQPPETLNKIRQGTTV